MLRDRSLSVVFVGSLPICGEARVSPKPVYLFVSVNVWEEIVLIFDTCLAAESVSAEDGYDKMELWIMIGKSDIQGRLTPMTPAT